MNKATNLFRNPSVSLRLSSSFSHSAALSPTQPPHDLAACIASLQACARRQNLRKGKQVHSFMLANGFVRSPLSTTSLINMYSKCNQMDDAVSTFNYQSFDHNVFAYNAVIAGFIANGLGRDGFEFYRRMRFAGVLPDKFTFPCVIRGCSGVLELRKIHGLVVKFGLELDVYVGSALVNTYLKFGLMEEAQEVFDELPVRDVVLWNAMVNGFAQIGRLEEALAVFRMMGEEGVVPSRFTVTGVLSVFAVMGGFNNGRAVHGFATKMGYDSGVEVLNALIDMYGKCKCVGDALKIFEMMVEKDIYSWNSIIAVHEQCGDHDGTLRLFDRMLRAGVLPDLVTITTVLPVCAHLAALMHGREIHGYMIKNGLERDVNVDDVQITNAVMDMYAKCGSMRNAYMVFDKMRNKDVASWNIMIMGYGMHGYGSRALDVFSDMFEAQIRLDEVTFVGVLSACSHTGLVREGREFLRQMKSKYGVVPTIEHYTCVVDMLGRAGHLEEAYELVLEMPIETNPVLWRALLAACRLHGNQDLAEVAGQKVIELDPGHSGNYVLMSNLYVANGQYDEVTEVRHSMSQQNVKKTPGCSWIELKDGVHAFITGDRAHPKANFIYAELDSLTARLGEIGSVPHF
ncbi:pentatricopeptide repeat-containing protein [Pyrus ussuriensis x Pyrus communis]|uniref:Pentatricopeptide repeat-containing protein n=1 Tax=Pyrus ussuriensis x Pyrus communis TaxID=2448454 RepID=A0A5N5IBP2_9ROSA|nr:pentatricopeptide repeat-containing protein [Pyrus ussuriensis x Pyrus communis]